MKGTQRWRLAFLIQQMHSNIAAAIDSLLHLFMLLILFLPSASSLLLLLVLHLDLRNQVSRIFSGSDEHQPKLQENPLREASGQGENLVVIQDSVEIPRWGISRFF